MLKVLLTTEHEYMVSFCSFVKRPVEGGQMVFVGRVVSLIAQRDHYPLCQFVSSHFLSEGNHSTDLV